MRPARLAILVALTWGCSRETAPGAAAQAAQAERTAAPSASGIVPAPVADPPEAEADGGGTLLLRSEGGLIPAARAQRILHVGDSMAPLVGNYLRTMFNTDGRKYWVESIPSTSSLDWGGKRLLQDAMYRYDPEVVLISLGSNELFDPNPERRAGAIRQIVEDTRGRPCMWIGPPLWKKDTGFVRVLKQNLGHCRYFDSTSLRLPRMEDGRHPSWTGGYAWASAVWRALGGTEPVPTTRPVSLTPG